VYSASERQAASDGDLPGREWLRAATREAARNYWDSPVGRTSVQVGEGKEFLLAGTLGKDTGSMAAANSSPSGFSYAQAAKGRAPVPTPQAQHGKPISGAATPATASFTELTAGGNWADDVEASVTEKTTPEAQKAAPEQGKGVQAKDSAVERAKSEGKAQGTASGVSSPDLTASASTSTHDDDASTAPTDGSSADVTSWEQKSQSSSEPAWIAERKERQSNSQPSEQQNGKGSKKAKESSSTTTTPPLPPKQPVLTDAAPPQVNIWTLRAEQRNAKQQQAAQQQPPKPAPSPTTEANSLKENQRPRTEPRKKANSVADLQNNGDSPFDTPTEAKKSAGAQGKRPNDVRTSPQSLGSKPSADAASSGSGARTGTQMHSSLPNLKTAPPPSVNDESSWPTPDTVQEKDRKEIAEKETPEKPSEDTAPSTKSNKKREWQPMPVTPNIIFETPMPKGREPRGGSGSERGGRGSLRSRGGFRGSANGGSGRNNSSQSEEDNNGASRGRPISDRESMPPPPKPARASSANSFHRKGSEPNPERSTRGNGLAEIRPYNKAAKGEGKSSEERRGAASWKDAQADMPRTSSPAKMDTTLHESQEEDRIPEPIPRRNSVGTQTENTGDQTESNAPLRYVASESRKENRSFENGFKEPNFNGHPRGSKRGGRGRGGSREFVNGHQANQAQTNGDYPASPYSTVPPSPSFRGNHQFTYPPQGRAGWARGNPRAQSIPLDAYYGRFSGAYGQQLPPLNTYITGMYDYAGYPMTAMSYTTYPDPLQVEMIAHQVEYWFSVDNLLKDIFLRKNMDSQGFVLLDVIAGFNRIKTLTTERDVLRTACTTSENIEICKGEDGKERLRKREGWEQFLLPIDQREPNAQNEGPQQIQRLERPQFMQFVPPPYRGQASAGGPGITSPRRSYDNGYTSMNGMAPAFPGFGALQQGEYGETTNGEDNIRGRSAKSPMHDSVSPGTQSHQDAAAPKDTEPDAFLDEQASSLTVFVKMTEPRGPHGAATRTFSNGSIDSRSIFGELEKSKEELTAPDVNGEAEPNGVESTMPSPRQASPEAARSPEHSSVEPQIQWSKENRARDGVMGETYTNLRLRALDQRDHAATGNCPYDLDVLYQFWAHFLLRNFNSKMYAEFKYFANEDGKQRCSLVGLQNLLKYYDHALLSSSTIRDSVIHDYVELVCNEPAALDGAAFKQLRAAWRNGAMALKNRKKLADIVSESLKERLEG
jgi:la-related protein 1